MSRTTEGRRQKLCPTRDNPSPSPDPHTSSCWRRVDTPWLYAPGGGPSDVQDCLQQGHPTARLPALATAVLHLQGPGSHWKRSVVATNCCTPRRVLQEGRLHCIPALPPSTLLQALLWGSPGGSAEQQPQQGRRPHHPPLSGGSAPHGAQDAFAARHCPACCCPAPHAHGTAKLVSCLLPSPGPEQCYRTPCRGCSTRQEHMCAGKALVSEVRLIGKTQKSPHHPHSCLESAKEAAATSCFPKRDKLREGKAHGTAGVEKQAPGTEINRYISVQNMLLPLYSAPAGRRLPTGSSHIYK